MIITNLKLHNIRSYTDIELNFQEGSTLLAGDIGAGKSTVLMAIEFALFGLNRGQGANLLRNGSQEGSVELSFKIDTNNITIKRNLKRSTSIKQESGYILINGIKKEATAQELKSEIYELLGYPLDIAKQNFIYRYTIYTPQESMKEILLGDKDARLDVLRKVFNFEKYKIIKENIIIAKKHMRQQIQFLKGSTEDIEKLEKDKQEYDEKIKQLSKQQSEFNIEQLKQQVESEKSELEQIEEKVRQNNLKKQERVKFKTKIESNEQQLKQQKIFFSNLQEELNIISQDLKQYESLNEQEILTKLKNLETEFEQKNKIKLQSEIQFKKLNEDIKKLTEVISSNSYIDDKISHLTSNLNLIQEQLKKKIEYDEKVNNLNSLLENKKIALAELHLKKQQSHNLKMTIQQLKDCPTCHQQVNVDHKLKISNEENLKIQQLELQLDKLNSEHKSLQNSINEYSELLKDIDSKKDLENRLKTKLATLQEKKNSLDLNKKLLQEKQLELQNIKQIEDLTYLKQQIDELKINKEKAQKKINLNQRLDEKQKQNKTIKTIIENLEKENKELRKKIENIQIKNLDDLHNQIKQNYDQKNKYFNEQNLQYQKITTELENNTKFLKNIVNNLEEKKQKQSKLIHIKQIYNWTDTYFIELMNIIEKNLMLKIYHDFNDLFVDWFNILIQDENLQARLDEQFTPVIIQNGYDSTIQSLSGGEKTALSLAYRLSLNKVINDLQNNLKTNDLLILDEPTDGFSNDQLDRVRDVLDQLDMKQVILVSHEDKIESFVDNIIRINKENHISSLQ